VTELRDYCSECGKENPSIRPDCLTECHGATVVHSWVDTNWAETGTQGAD